jgi:hypothetical protein
MKNHTFRVAVGDSNGAQSTVWRIWTNRTDVYVSARDIAGDIKVSLHQSGTSQIGFTAESAEKRGIHPHARLASRWHRPTGGKVVREFQIIIPASEVVPLRHQAGRKADISWQPVSSPGTCTYLTLFHGAGWSADPDPLLQVDDVLVTQLESWALPNGDHVWVTLHAAALSPEQHTQLVDTKREILSHSTAKVRRARNPRGFAFGEAPDGSRFLIDVCLY